MKRTAIALAIGILPFASGDATPSDGLLDVDPDVLRVVESTEARSMATFGYSATYVTITSERITDSKAKASVMLDGKEFVVELDSAARSATWSGGGATLTPDDLAALSELGDEVETSWLRPASMSGEDLTQHRELSVRLIMLLAEAPPGVALGTQTITAPDVRFETKADLQSAADEMGYAVEPNQPCVRPAKRTIMSNSCQVEGEDGIVVMDCVGLYRPLEHDTENHCYLYESIFSGPGSSGCLGMCGSGCEGIGTYTYDCGDHDRCGRVHGGSGNPWDGDCGDEFFDADDDFLQAPDDVCSDP